MDNLYSHKGPQVRALIEAAGVGAISSALQPRLQSNRMMFPKLKALLRNAAERIRRRRRRPSGEKYQLTTAV